MAVIEDSARAMHEEARAETHIRDISFDGGNQMRNFAWIIFEISILHDDNRTRASSKSGNQRRSFALICLMAIQLDPILLAAIGMTNLRSEIARSIVDHDDFVNIGKIFKDPVQDGADRPLLVECRNDKAQQVVVHDVKWKDGRIQPNCYFGFFKAAVETVKEISFETGLSLPAVL